MERSELIKSLAGIYIELEKVRVNNDINLNEVLIAMEKKLERMKDGQTE